MIRYQTIKVPITKFIPHVIANTIGAEDEGMLPEAAALSFIRNAIIDFADRSGIITEKVCIDLQCGLSEYLIETPESTIIGIKKAEMGEWAHLNSENSFNWRWGEVKFEMEDDVINIWPTPTADVRDELKLELAVTPARDACEVDEVFYNKYFNAIIDGAMAEIHLMPNYPWSSVSRADYRRKRFEDAISKAVVRRVQKGNRRPLRMEPNMDWVPSASCGYRRRW